MPGRETAQKALWLKASVHGGGLGVHRRSPRERDSPSRIEEPGIVEALGHVAGGMPQRVLLGLRFDAGDRGLPPQVVADREKRLEERRGLARLPVPVTPDEARRELHVLEG